MSHRKKTIKINQIWTKAQKHRQASILGLPADNGEYELCQCCGQVVEKQPFSLCEHTKEFERYGFGYPLWFSFLKYCIILILVLIASKTANELYMGATQNWEFCYGLGEANNNQYHSDSKKQIVNQDSQIENKSNKNLQKQQDKQTHLEPIPVQNKNQQSSQHFNNSQKLNKNIKLSASSSEVKCTSFMVFLSIFKGQKMFDNYFLKTVEFVIHLIALITIRNMILKQEQYYDQRSTLISKYSIIIHNLPNVINLKRKLNDLFSQQFGCTYGQQDSEIKEFIYIFKDDKLNELNKEKQKLQKEILNVMTDGMPQDNGQQEFFLREKLTKLEKQLQDKIQQTQYLMDADKIKCNKMIIIMNTEGDKASVLYTFKQAMKEGKNFNHYFYDVDQIDDQGKSNKSQPIFMKQAPQPNEIIWEHLYESDKQRKFLIFRGYLLTFLFLAAITVVFYFIMLAKTSLFLKALKMEEEDPQNVTVSSFKIFATFIVFTALLSVVLFNKFVMGNVIHKFVHMQHHAYTDKQNHSFALKYALGMFFTTALMTIAVEAITYNNFYQHQYGVIQQETIMFVASTFIIPIIWWIHPYNKVKNMIRKKKIGTEMSQKQANELVEPYPYMQGKRYAQVFEIMWFTFLYSELLPLGSFLMLIGLVLYYWVDKYNFLRNSAVKTRVSGKMAILGLKSLDATLFLAPAGQFLFSFLLRHKFDITSLIFCGIGIIYTCLPVTSFIWQINGQKFLIQQKPYEESKSKFKETYFSLHPIYKLTHKDQIQKHKLIVQEFYKKDLKKVKHYGRGRGNYHRQTTLFTKRCTETDDLQA